MGSFTCGFQDFHATMETIHGEDRSVNIGMALVKYVNSTEPNNEIMMLPKKTAHTVCHRQESQKRTLDTFLTPSSLNSMKVKMKPDEVVQKAM